MNEKKAVGERAVEFIEDGMIIGLGTGSTVFYTLQLLGKLVKEGFSVRGIPTSRQTEMLADKLSIPITSFEEVDHVDVAIDGADEVSGNLDLIKGGGGALLREKIVAKSAKKFIVVADSNKLVGKLGSFGIPVEVVPFGIQATISHIKELGLKPVVRQNNGNPVITDNGNYLLDCMTPKGIISKELEISLNMIPGVVENGLFIGMTNTVITLNEDKEVVIMNLEALH